MAEEVQVNGVSVKPIGHRHLTPDEIKKGCVEVAGDDHVGTRICRINEELHQGMTEMEAYEKAVTFYGSARFREGHPYYERIRTLASRISKECGYTVTTGGGPGVMEAANRGAFEAGGKSVGLSIALPMEQHDNGYITDSVPFYFFFARKVALSYSSSVFIFCPGGFGTLDEFFEVITLIQTGKLKPIPIILYGTDFWGPIKDMMQTLLLDKFATIDLADLDLFTITDDDNVVLDIVKNAAPRGDNHGD